jgi:Zn finger protein HypA/HybF involved in hydrogenase expression
MMDWFECLDCRKVTLILPDGQAECPHCGSDQGRIIRPEDDESNVSAAGDGDEREA